MSATNTLADWLETNNAAAEKFKKDFFAEPKEKKEPKEKTAVKKEIEKKEDV